MAESEVLEKISEKKVAFKKFIIKLSRAIADFFLFNSEGLRW